MTAQQLKNSILQMAVQGKLVPQDPNDEPASVLLERIRAEKEALIKAKKIKREKNPSVIFRGADNTPYEKIGDEVRPLDVPFDIPNSWEWARISDIFQIEMGQSPDGNAVSERSDGMEFHQGKVFFGEMYIQKSKQTTTAPTKIAPPNSILLCVRAPVGKVNITDRELCIGRGLCALKPLGDITTAFAYHLFETYENTFIKQATGTTFVAITGEVVKNQLVPVPPLGEQNRILERLNELLPFIDVYATVYSKQLLLDKEFPTLLKKSILQWAVQGKLVPQDPSDEPAGVLLERIREEKQRLVKEGKIKKDKHESVIFRRDNSHYEKLDGIERCIDDEIPFEIPDSWTWVRASSLLSISSGDSLTTQKMDGGDYPVYGGNGVAGHHSQYNVEQPTLVIGRVGFYCGSTHITGPKAWVTDNAFITTFFNSDISMIWFKFILDAAELRKRSSSTAQPVISGKTIYPLLVALPPLAEQHRIVEKIEEILPMLKGL